MKQIRLVIFCLFALLLYPALWGQESRAMQLSKKKRDFRPVNFGFKAGFNSSMYTVSTFKINGIKIDDTQNNYKIGYFTSAFVRFNLTQKHYIQSEFIYQQSRCQVTFDKLGSEHPESDPEYASVTSKLNSLDFPILYGYNIINKGYCGLSVFAGPKFKYLWNQKNKIDFENFDRQLEEKLRPINLSLTAGVAVTISKIFFDFRYEHGLNNISKGINSVDASNTEPSNIVFRRTEQILSFSFGMMF